MKEHDFGECHFEGCNNAYDLGWKHGTLDIGESYKYEPGVWLSKKDFLEYVEGYKDARRGWN